MNTVHLRLLAALFETFENDDHSQIGMTKKDWVEFGREVWSVCAEHVRKGSPKIQGRPIPTTNCIGLYFHCRLCMESLPKGMSPQQWCDNEVGYTELGLQVWCKRHQVNVIHVDFEGHKFPANRDAVDAAKVKKEEAS